MERATPVSIQWKPDPASGVPVYQQIMDYIRGKVARGEWPVGTRLPAQRAMAEAFGVNRSTVTTALEELASYGLLAGHRGAGTRVVSNTWSLLLPQAPDWGQYLSAGFFRENLPAVQTINRMEFAPGITRLGTGELDPGLFPVDLWREVVGTVGRNVTDLGYLEPLGLPELREALSDHLATLGIAAPPSCILITSGALQGLQLIASCLLPRGATVFTEAPSYLKSLQVVQSAGVGLRGIPMDGEGLRVRELEARLTGGRRRGDAILYTIPTNQNPTGTTMGEARRRELLEVCTAHRLPVVEDGAYQELCYDGPMPTPLKAMDSTGAVLHLGSAAKTLAPGLRVGWIVAPEPIVQRLGDVKMQMDYGASSVSQWILAEFFRSGAYGRYLGALKEELRQRRDHALKVLEDCFGGLARWERPQGGFYIWLTLTGDCPMAKLFARAGQEGILLNPGDLYDFQDSRSLRLSYAYASREAFAAGAARLAELVGELGG